MCSGYKKKKNVVCEMAAILYSVFGYKQRKHQSSTLLGFYDFHQWQAASLWIPLTNGQ